MRRRGIGVGAASLAATCAIVAAGCGGSSGGPVTLNLLGPLDPGGTNTKAAKECSEKRCDHCPDSRSDARALRRVVGRAETDRDTEHRENDLYRGTHQEPGEDRAPAHTTSMGQPQGEQSAAARCPRRSDGCVSGCQGSNLLLKFGLRTSPSSDRTVGQARISCTLPGAAPKGSIRTSQSLHARLATPRLTHSVQSVSLRTVVGPVK